MEELYLNIYLEKGELKSTLIVNWNVTLGQILISVLLK